MFSGQESNVHNHRDQMCWMLVPIGKLQAEDYHVESQDPATGTCTLQPIVTYQITPTAPAQVDTTDPVHKVMNLAEFNQRAVSLHIYSNPFDSCEVYQIEKETYADVPLYYTSQYGQLCAGKTAVRHQP